MIEPVALADFFTAFFSAAMVILCGALYALLFAYSRIQGMPKLMLLAYFSYLGLVVSVFFLASAANLFSNNFWATIVGLMLLGYFFAPRAIWKLCVGTHSCEQGAPESFHDSDRSILL
jgi:hypothetical protein